MEESIARLEKAVDKCIENARHAGVVSGALMVIAQLNLSRKEGISLLAKSIGISKKKQLNITMSALLDKCYLKNGYGYYGGED